MDMDLLPERIGPYQVLGRLGHGGMGEVLRGYDDRLDRPVALKRVLSDVRDPEKALQRFRREARAVARLSHPAIVQVYGWEEGDGLHWLVMELVEGRSLGEVIAEGPLTPARALEIARDLASGLAEAHDAGIIHRDLKSSNVMVTVKGSCKILDFGLAKTVRLEPVEDSRTASVVSAALTKVGNVVGTVTAMSPEQAQGKPVDHRGDLFSLGILLYEMLSGVLPFRGDSAIETLTRICTLREEPLRRLDPEIPEGVARLVSWLLEKEPARRPQHAREVVAEIDRLGSGARDPPASTTDEWAFEQETRISQMAAPVVFPPVEATRAGEGVRGSSVLRRRWALAVAGVVIAVGLPAAWLGLTTADRPAADVQAASSAPLPDTELNRHDLYLRGMTFLDRFDREGNIEKAIDDFQRTLALDENHAPALAGLAQAYRLDFIWGGRDPQRIEQAMAVAEQAVRVDEYLALSRVSLGLVYCEIGRFDDAKRELEQALQIEPLNAAAWAGLGFVAKSQADLTRAEECYLRAVEKQPDNWFWHSFLGSFYYSTGRYEEAANSITRQLELAPDNFIGLRNLGAVHYMQGRLAEAATQFQKALQIRQDPNTYSNLGTIYFAQGLYAQSVSAFEKALGSSGGGGGGSFRYQKWANLGDAYRWTPDKERQAREAYLQALELLDEKLALMPNDTNLRTLVPLYNSKLGNCDQAMADIATLGDLSEDDATAWFQIAVASEVCGRRDDALAALETALRAGYPPDEVNGDPELLKLRQDVRYDPSAMPPPG